MKYRRAEHLRHISYEIRGKIAKRAAQLKFQGIDIIELNIGNPGAFGFRVPDAMNMAMIRNIDKSSAYCDSKGIFSAREAIVIDTQVQGIKGVGIDSVFIGNGVSELIMTSMEALLNPADEVLVPSPDYPLWTAAVTIANGGAKHYRCQSDNLWLPDLTHMESLITPKTRAVCVINPNNPTGSVYPRKLLLEIIALARKHKLIVLADEIYSRVLFDGVEHIPMATLADDVLVATYNGLSKNYRACGYRSGWLYFTGPVDDAQDYLDGLTNILSMRLCPNVLGQHAIQTALGGYQSIIDLCAKGGRLKVQRDYTYERLSKIAGISVAKPQGSMYCFANIDLKRFGFGSDEEFVLEFLEEKHVLLVPGSGFNYNDAPAFRVAFLAFQEILQSAFDRLESFLRRREL